MSIKTLFKASPGAAKRFARLFLFWMGAVLLSWLWYALGLGNAHYADHQYSHHSLREGDPAIIFVMIQFIGGVLVLPIAFAEMLGNVISPRGALGAILGLMALCYWPMMIVFQTVYTLKAKRWALIGVIVLLALSAPYWFYQSLGVLYSA
ncbi:MAG: hypothetical protein ACPGVT_12920 [Maricaulaceae bacterium]